MTDKATKDFFRDFFASVTKNALVDIRHDEFLTQDEVAKKLKISRETLRKAIKTGAFPESVTIANQSRWPSSLINAHIRETNEQLKLDDEIWDAARAAIKEAGKKTEASA
ncbi:hypothetical protein GCM10023116_13350 [Kistimonas scapharcae]|uniref:Helix-turn-helix domain-containing protein n=1 Tax=Kistimonas scapharcae TaxID=1036133 RepID=A0ABP8UZF9_9GAMM